MLCSLDEISRKFDRVERSEIETHAYQTAATDFLWKTPFGMLFIDTGLGKTVIVLMLLVRLIMSFACRKVLIVAPVRVAAQTWPTEIQLWDFAAFLNWTVIRAEDDDEEVISAGKAAYKEARERGADSKEAQKAAQKARTEAKRRLRLERARSRSTIHIINKEAVPWLVEQYTVKEGRKKRLHNWPYDVVIIDESSCVKAFDTALFEALQLVRLYPGLKRLHQMTATPAAESYEGMFTQVYLSDRGERLGRNITAYRDEYMKPHPFVKFKYVMLKGADEKIAEIISDIALVMKSEDYLDETPPLFLERKITLAPHELDQYKRFQRDFILTLEDGEEIEAETAAALSSKLLQLASGAVYDENKKARHVHDHKLEDLKQLVEELSVAGEPLMVAYWYQSSLARLKKAFPKAVVMDKAGKCVGPWNAGKIDLLLVHPASVGHGLNMQKGPGHDLYFFDACWSYELYYQLYRRLHRQGQKKRVRVHLAQVVGTVDELVFSRLVRKRDAQEVLFRRIKALWKLRSANDNTEARRGNRAA